MQPILSDDLGTVARQCDPLPRTAASPFDITRTALERTGPAELPRLRDITHRLTAHRLTPPRRGALHRPGSTTPAENRKPPASSAPRSCRLRTPPPYRHVVLLSRGLFWKGMVAPDYARDGPNSLNPPGTATDDKTMTYPFELSTVDRTLLVPLSAVSDLMDEIYWSRSGVDRTKLDELWLTYTDRIRRESRPEHRYSWPQPQWAAWIDDMVHTYDGMPEHVGRDLLLQVAGRDGLWIQVCNFGIDDEYPHICQVHDPQGIVEETIAKDLSWSSEEQEDLQARFWGPGYAFKAPYGVLNSVAKFLAIVLETTPEHVTIQSLRVGSYFVIGSVGS